MTLEDIAKAYPDVPVQAIEAAYALPAGCRRIRAGPQNQKRRQVSVGPCDGLEPGEKQWYYYQLIRAKKQEDRARQQVA